MKRLAFIFVALVTAFNAAVFLRPMTANAASNSNMIDNAVFDNSGAMDANAIDNWLNSNFPNSCISLANGFQSQDPTGYTPDANNIAGDYSYGVAVSAGTVIAHAAQAHQINPRVLLTKLENEENLVTGNQGCPTWRYTSAVGYACTDSDTNTHDYSYPGGGLLTSLYFIRGNAVNSVTGSCVNQGQFAGFSEQVVHAAWLLSWARHKSEGQTDWAAISGNFNHCDDNNTCPAGMNIPSSFACYEHLMTQGNFKRCPTDSSTTFYDGFATIDGQSVHLDNGATASLYVYTPHFQSFDDIWTPWFGSPTNVCGNDIVDVGSSGTHIAGDFNADGHTEAAVFRPGDGCWHVRAVGDSLFGTNGDIPVPGDYNGDGRTDIGVFRPTQLVNGEAQWHIRGVGDFGFGHTGDIPVPGDYNGDGKTDIAIYRPSEQPNGDIMWHIRGVGDFAFGHTGDIPVPGDYNGDGKTDIAVFRPSTGDWHIRGVGDYTAYGQSGDIPVPADYNGDGRTDAAVFRPSQLINGDVAWHIRGVGDYGFGHNGDIPVPGDYNGDRWNRIGVFRNGDWHIRAYGDFNGYGTTGDLPATQTLNVKILDDYYSYNISY